MPRPQRAPRARRVPISEAERLWAHGALDDSHPDAPEVVFFTAPERLRAVWRAVHGESFGRWLLRHPERWRPGEVLVHVARVAVLTDSDIDLLRAGVDPWADED